MWRALAAVAAGAVTAGTGAAAAANEPDPAPPIERVVEDEFSAIQLFGRVTRLRPRVRVAEEWTIDQDFSGADVDTYRSLLLAQVVAPVSRRVAIRLLASGSANAYAFHGDRRFLDTGNTRGDPFDELLSTQLRFETRYQLSDEWSLVAGGVFRSRWERGAPYGSGIQGEGFAGLGYLFAGRLSVVGGVAVRSRLGRGGATVGPLVALGWKVTENLEIETDGLGGRIAYRPVKPLTLFVRGALDSDRYRLKQRDGDVGRGVLQDRTAPVVAGWSWRFSKHWRFQGQLGAVVYQKWRVTTRSGDTVDTAVSRSPAFTGRLQIEYRM